MKEQDYLTKLDELEQSLSLLQEAYLKVVKERDRYKKSCAKLKREKGLDYTEEEYETV